MDTKCNEIYGGPGCDNCGQCMRLNKDDVINKLNNDLNCYRNQLDEQLKIDCSIFGIDGKAAYRAYVKKLYEKIEFTETLLNLIN